MLPTIESEIMSDKDFFSFLDHRVIEMDEVLSARAQANDSGAKSIRDMLETVLSVF